MVQATFVLSMKVSSNKKEEKHYKRGDENNFIALI
jgi:hypothetical protein